MKRLTEKVLGFTQLKDCGNDFCKETCAEHDEEKSCNNCPVQKAFEKLAQYEDLEEQGKLLKLPCNIGDFVFVINKNKFIELHQIIAIEMIDDGIYCKSDYRFCRIDDFGKTVFSTKEEAEAVLKGTENENSLTNI